jgi:hypothetical protein
VKGVNSLKLRERQTCLYIYEGWSKQRKGVAHQSDTKGIRRQGNPVPYTHKCDPVYQSDCLPAADQLGCRTSTLTPTNFRYQCLMIHPISDSLQLTTLNLPSALACTVGIQQACTASSDDRIMYAFIQL